MRLAVLQARFSSTRLPGKVLKPILGRPMLSLQVERTRRSRMLDELVIATSIDSTDDEIEVLCKGIKVPCFRGSLNDVLDRFYNAAIRYEPEHVVRLTGDCPLVDPGVIDSVIGFYLDGCFDYASNTLEPTFPDGLDVEVFKFSALKAAWKEAMLPSEREHVTPFIHRRPERFKLGSYKAEVDLSHLRWTVDEPEDLELVSRIYESLYPYNPEFTTRDILDLLQKEPSLLEINNHIIRNLGAKKSEEQDRLFLQKGLKKL